MCIHNMSVNYCTKELLYYRTVLTNYGTVLTNVSTICFFGINNEYIHVRELIILVLRIVYTVIR
jgi:hypothetical protein